MLKELTLKLQQLAADVVHAYKMVTSVVSTLSKMCEESQREFHKVYLDTTALGRKLHGDDFEIRKPRVTSRMAHRDNPSTESAEDYYRIVMYDAFLSHVVSELEDRFVKLPDNTEIPPELAEVVSTYDINLPNPSMFSIEYNDWVRKWRNALSSSDANSSSNLPDRLIVSIKQCSTMTYPNLHALFRIALTLPITSCE